MKRPIIPVLIGILAIFGSIRSQSSRASSAMPPAAIMTIDRLFPGLGNIGYDVIHYNLELSMNGKLRDPVLSGSVAIRLRTTTALSRLGLDFVGGSVKGVRVNGRPASFVRFGEKLSVSLPRAFKTRQLATVMVNYTIRPSLKIPLSQTGMAAGFGISQDGIVFTGQPDRGHAAFPCNDLPSDAASMSFRLSVPSGLSAIANGSLVRHQRSRGREIFTWRLETPITPQLTALAFGRFKMTPNGRVASITVRHALGAHVSAIARARLQDTARELRWLSAKLGAYPYKQYGALVSPGSIDGEALETATMSTFGSSTLDGNDGKRGALQILAHELVHQWFGDWVRVRNWSDLWLNEGHATYWGTRYVAEVTGTRKAWIAEFNDYQKNAANHDRNTDGSPAYPRNAKVLFSGARYEGGALVLIALERRVGERRFLQIERRFLVRFGGSSATTQNYIDTAAEIVGPSIRSFLQRWLYAPKTPR